MYVIEIHLYEGWVKPSIYALDIFARALKRLAPDQLSAATVNCYAALFIGQSILQVQKSRQTIV